MMLALTQGRSGAHGGPHLNGKQSKEIASIETMPFLPEEDWVENRIRRLSRYDQNRGLVENFSKSLQGKT